MKRSSYWPCGLLAVDEAENALYKFLTLICLAAVTSECAFPGRLGSGSGTSETGAV